MTPLLRRLEALLFAAGRPLPEHELAAALGVRLLDLPALLDQYRAQLTDRGFELSVSEAGVTLLPAVDLQETVARALRRMPDRLTAPVLEVLAVVARYQPVDRSTIERIRGVRSDRSLAVLEEEGLIEVAGRGEGPGRPVLWRTTPEFLLRFGLKSLAELDSLWPDEA